MHLIKILDSLLLNTSLAIIFYISIINEKKTPETLSHDLWKYVLKREKEQERKKNKAQIRRSLRRRRDPLFSRRYKRRRRASRGMHDGGGMNFLVRARQETSDLPALVARAKRSPSLTYRAEIRDSRLMLRAIARSRVFTYYRQESYSEAHITQWEENASVIQLSEDLS